MLLAAWDIPMQFGIADMMVIALITIGLLTAAVVCATLAVRVAPDDQTPR